MAFPPGRSVHFSPIDSPRFVASANGALRAWPWAGAAVIGLVLSVGWAATGDAPKSETSQRALWRVGKPVPIVVRQGRSSFQAPARSPSSELLVVVSSLAHERGPFSVQLAARPARTAAVPSIAVEGLAVCATASVPDPRARAAPNPERARPDPAHCPSLLREGTSSERGRPEPPPERVFHMLVRDGDVYSPSNYVAVPAVLRGVGQRIQVYVAREDLDSVGDLALGDIINAFDERIFPVISSRFGPAPDVDGDRRFTVLVSSWLEHMGGGRFAVDGFIRVADLDRTIRPPLGNQCDVMYLSASLKSGPYLRTVLAHEYMHAVLFGQKGRGAGQAGGPGKEEEGWLDEAIAHLAEDSCGFSTSNIDYRVRAFLACPERYQLVVDDYYAADLFRSHGNRGSTYLFLRWCADRYGRELLPALVTSNTCGTANLEACTGTAFTELYRGWTLELVCHPREQSAEGPVASRDQAPRAESGARLEDWVRGGPRLSRLTAGSVDRWDALGTTSHYVIVDGSTSGAVDIEVSGPASAQLQVTAVPLGDDRPRLDLSVAKLRGAGGELFLRACIKERHGQPVKLTQLSWEPLSPGPSRRRGEGCRGRMEGAELEKSLGALSLAASGELTSQPIHLAGAAGSDEPLVVQLGGVDASGRPIWAWAELGR
jgi:hypothetical protein